MNVTLCIFNVRDLKYNIIVEIKCLQATLRLMNVEKSSVSQVFFKHYLWGTMFTLTRTNVDEEKKYSFALPALEK